MALRAAGDDYEHSAIQKPEQVVASGPRAAFRGEWVDRPGHEGAPFRGVDLRPEPSVPQKIDRGLCVDIIADAVYAAQPMTPSSALAIAEAILEKLRDCGYVISRG